MKILHLTRNYPPNIRGGLSVAVGDLVNATIPDASHTILSFDDFRPARQTLTPLQREDSDHIDVLRIRGPDALRDAATCLTQRHYNLVIAHDAMAFEAASSVISLREIPVAAYVHVLYSRQQRLRDIERPTRSLTAQRRLLQRAHRILAPSPWCAHAISADFELGATPIHAIPACLPDFLFEPSPDPPPPPTLLHAGRFDVLKGTRDVLASFEHIHTMHPDVRLLMLGGNPEKPARIQKWRRRWESTAPSDATRRTTWSPWNSRQHTRSAIARSVLAVAPSRLETLGLFPLEAMAAGRPVILHRTSALAASLSRREAIIWNDDDPAELASLIHAALSDREGASRMGRRARRWALAHASTTSTRQQVLCLLSTCATTARPLHKAAPP